MLEAGDALFFRAAQQLFDQLFAAVRIYKHRMVILGRALRFPKEFAESLVGADIVLVERVVLLSNNFAVVRFSRVVAGPKQILKSLPLERSQP